MTIRLPARLEVSALVRRTQAEGDFATIIQKGDPDAGSIMVVVTQRGIKSKAYERPPQIDGTSIWQCSRIQSADDEGAFAEYLSRRHQQDHDLWIIELDVADSERFIL